MVGTLFVCTSRSPVMPDLFILETPDPGSSTVHAHTASLKRNHEALDDADDEGTQGDGKMMGYSGGGLI